MKKVIALAFIGSLAIISCSKGPDHSLQDSNVMLQEPEATVTTDSAAAPATSEGNATTAETAAPAVADSTATK